MVAYQVMVLKHINIYLLAFSLHSPLDTNLNLYNFLYWHQNGYYHLVFFAERHVYIVNQSIERVGLKWIGMFLKTKYDIFTLFPKVADWMHYDCVNNVHIYVLPQ